MSARSPHRRGRFRALAVGALVPLALVAGMALPPAAEWTEAAWTDSTVTSAQAEAAVIPAPTLTEECRYRPGLLGIGARVEIYWQLPEQYSLDDVVVEASTSGLGSALAPLTGFDLGSNTEQNADGSYTTEVRTNLLGGLLGLGSELEIAFAVQDDSGWHSEHASVATNAGLVAGLGGDCRNLT